MSEAAQLVKRVTSNAELMASGGEAFARALRMGKELAVMVVDVDYFKTVNDTWGHAVGDQVLLGISEICDHKMRKRDLIGRLGGDEFGFVLLDTAREGALVVAERLRRTIATRPFSLLGPTGEEEGPLHVTVSIGLADLGTGAASLPEMFDQARRALQAAKENGRNRVEAFGLKTSG